MPAWIKRGWEAGALSLHAYDEPSRRGGVAHRGPVTTSICGPPTAKFVKRKVAPEVPAVVAVGFSPRGRRRSPVLHTEPRASSAEANPAPEISPFPRVTKPSP